MVNTKREKVNLIHIDYTQDNDKKALERMKKIEEEKLSKLSIAVVSDKLTVYSTNANRLTEYIKEYGKL
jgi:hypothetical protein